MYIFSLINAIILIQNLIILGLSLELRKMAVPGPCQNGSSLWLQCNYELTAQETLYSVKWYKNNLEFYRYALIHSESSDHQQFHVDPVKQYFLQPGIHVDINRSNGSHVYLNSINLDGEGLFACEVSTEDDNGSFKSIKAEKDLRVYVLPQSKLRFIGKKDSYEIGDQVDLSCITGPSKPPTILALFINGHRILQSERNLNFSWNVQDIDSDGLTLSWINVSFKLTKENGLFDGFIDIRCSSLQSQISGYSYEELIIEETGHFSKISEAYPSLDESDGLSSSLSSPSWFPTIHGIIGRARVGDHISINCTGPNSNPSVFIHWFINNKEPSIYSIQQPVTQSDIDKPGYQFTLTIYDYFASFEEMNPPSTIISFKISKKLFQTVDGAMRLRCLSVHAKQVYREDSLLTLFTDAGRSSRLLFYGSQRSNQHDSSIGLILFTCCLYCVIIEFYTF